MSGKCTFPAGVTIKPDGIHEVEIEACIYDTIEVHRNVTVEVRRCRRCGNIDIAWFAQDDTVSEVKED